MVLKESEVRQMKYTTYCVKQNIVDLHGNIMENHIVRDSIYSLETAEKIAREFEYENRVEFSDIRFLNDGYRYTFTVEEE